MANKIVKILYCKDENDNPVFYINAKKNKKYYCIDCGEELTIKNGNIKQKHLAHKANSSCLSTGESYIHKYYKEHLFIPGITINTEKGIATIEKVLTEEWLNNRYEIAKTWDKKIRPDVILETDKGDVIVELCKSNPKKWEDLVGYYDQIKSYICEIFELYIDSINSFRWVAYNEITHKLDYQRKRKRKKELYEQKKYETVLKAIKNREKGRSWFYYNIGTVPGIFNGFIQIVGATMIKETFKIVYLRIKYKSEEEKIYILNKFWEKDNNKFFKMLIEYQYIDPSKHMISNEYEKDGLPIPFFKADNVLFCTQLNTSFREVDMQREQWQKKYIVEVLEKIPTFSDALKKDSIYKEYLDAAQRDGIIKSSNHNEK